MSAPDKVYPAAREAASVALALDPDLPDAYFALGWVALSYEWDWHAAEGAFRRAIELEPNNYMGYYGLAWALQVTGRSDEALAAASFLSHIFACWGKRAVLIAWSPRVGTGPGSVF